MTPMTRSLKSAGFNRASSQYRKLVAESQPDEFVMRGMPKEFILLATEKVAAINDAYDAIAKERGI
jgi:DnaJ like chaperone protein